MKIKVLALLFLFIANSLHVIADDNPIVSPTLSVRDSEGNEIEGEYNDRLLCKHLLWLIPYIRQDGMPITNGVSIITMSKNLTF